MERRQVLIELNAAVNSVKRVRRMCLESGMNDVFESTEKPTEWLSSVAQSYWDKEVYGVQEKAD